MQRRRADHGRRLSHGDHVEIQRRVSEGEAFASAVAAVSREVAWNGHRDTYRAWQAEKTAARRARRPKPEKLATHPRLCREVERRLLERWSAAADRGAARLRLS